MSSKTKIVVLHMKEIIYTVLFICLGILLVALLTFMFHPKNKETSSSKSTSYQPGIYTSQLTLGDIISTLSDFPTWTTPSPPCIR